jgi:hypothetical protein
MAYQWEQQVISLPANFAIDRQEDIKAAFFIVRRNDLVTKEKWKATKSHAQGIAFEQAKSE